MINNRQGGRRGRGRNNNGARPQNGAPRPEGGGNRIDNRSRGNANQLHEKYKTLARDAQMQGDRVMTEYYLQFADHYFRILNETRARFEEQRRPRDEAYAQGPYGTDLDYDGEDEGEEMMEDRVDPRGQRAPEPQRVERGQPERGQDDGERQPRFEGRGERQNRDGQGRDGQTRDGRDGQGRDNQARDGQTRENQGRDGQGREGQQARDGQRDGRDTQPREQQPREDRYERQPREERAERQPRQRDEQPRGREDQPQGIEGERVDMRGDREGRQDRTRRERGNRGERDGNRRERQPEGVATNGANGDGAYVSASRGAEPAEERIDLAVLPPAFAPSLSLPLPEPEQAADGEASSDGGEARPRRRRRTKAEMEAARAAAAAETGDVAA